MKQSPVATPPATNLDRAAILACLERILNSRAFRDAPTVQRFLRHVVLRALDGETDSLKEYSIGVEALQRGDGFDPRSDAIVRVQARCVRAKLASYYQEEGQQERWLIHLPKGCYIPEFHYRDILPPGKDPVATTPGARRWLKYLAAFLILVTGAAAGAVLTRLWPAREPPAKSADPAVAAFWGTMISSGSRINLVFGVPQFFTSDGIIVRDVFANTASSPGKRLAALSNSLPGKLEPVHYYTGQGETRGLCALQEFLLGQGLRTRIISTTDLRWSDLKDEHVVLLASLRFQHLLDSQNFPATFVASQNEIGVLRNLQPKSGEPMEFRNSIRSGSGTDYAVISVWPGKSPGRRIVMAAGMYTYGTQAAAEYIVRSESLRELQRHVPADCQYFQVLLEVEVHDDQPITTRFVTWHELPSPALARAARHPRASGPIPAF